MWYGEPNAISNAIGYAKLHSRSHDAVSAFMMMRATLSRRTSTRAISKSAEKVQAAILRKEQQNGRPSTPTSAGVASLPTEATPRLRKNYVIAPVAGKKIRSRARSLLIVLDHLRRRFARFKSATGRTRCGELCAHLLDVRSLLFELGQSPVLMARLF